MAVYALKLKPVFRAGTSLAVSAHNTGKRLVSRGALGRSSYLSAGRLTDINGVVVDYTSKRDGVEHSQVILPGGGTMEREALWNAVDNYRVRKDAIRPTVARSMIVATPHELSFEERKSVNIALARAIADRFGVAVDIGMHIHTQKELNAGSDMRNVHCHFLISERRISPIGELGTLQRDFNQMDCTRLDRRGRVARIKRRETAASEIRRMWERIANAALERGGYSERIDRRSLSEQGRSRKVSSSIYRNSAGSELKRSASLKAQIEESAKRIEAIQARRRIEVDKSVDSRLGDIDEWQQDALAAFMRAWQSEDSAQRLRKRLRAVSRNQRIMRKPTTKEVSELKHHRRIMRRAESMLQQAQID